MKYILVFIFLLFCLTGSSQSYIWWNEINNWDGITNWYRYLILSPKYLGPNALPVPDIKNGNLNVNSNFELSFENHYLKGDNTVDILTKLNLPLFSDRVAFNLSFVPVEYYKMDTIIRDFRHSRDYDAEGFSSGDLYIATYIQLIKDNDNFPDILLTINLKTASGNNLEAARFTDSPGYFFDLSFGKKYSFNSNFFKSVHPFAMLGFYCWQTNLDGHYQNDAFLYGLGFNITTKNIEISNQIGGYIGYIDNGDKPVVYRLILKSQKTAFMNYNFMFQQGFNDFLYTTLSFGLDFNLNKLKKK